jgi:RNA polymerase sigma-70 factor (ECF subfamily)
MNKMNNECCDIDQVVSDFYNHLKKYLIVKIKNNELAEDILQEVMFKVISAHRKNLPVKNLKAWIYQIARNTLVDYFRKKQTRAEENENRINEILFPLQDESFNPSDYLIPMIKLLPPKYSTPLLLSDIEYLPQAKIADKLGLSLSATKMRIQRARKKLHNLFLECCDINFTEDGAFLHCTVKESCVPLRNFK